MKKTAVFIVSALLCMPLMAEKKKNANRLYQECRQTWHALAEVTWWATVDTAGVCENAPSLHTLSGLPERDAEEWMSGASRRLEESERHCYRHLSDADIARLEQEKKQMHKQAMQVLEKQIPSSQVEKEKFRVAYCTQKAKGALKALERY